MKNKRPEYTLSDGLGTWCAWCFRYFRKGEGIEKHHMAGQTSVRDNLGINYSNLWTVPIHKPNSTYDCHNKKLGLYTQRLNSVIFSAMDAESKKDISKILNKAREHHDKQCPSVSQILKICALIDILKLTPSDVDRAAQVVIHLHATGSLLAWNWVLATALVDPHKVLRSSFGIRKNKIHFFRNNVDRCLATAPNYHLNRAKIKALRQQTLWRRDFAAAEDIINRLRENPKRRLLPALKRARASIATHMPGSTDSDLQSARVLAEEAVKSEEGSYVEKTARLLCAQLDFKFKDGAKNRIRDSFDILINEPDFPWGYRMKALFFGALAALEGGIMGLSQDEKYAVFNRLTEAQYIAGMMGLAPMVWPEGNRKIIAPSQADVYPSDYLTTKILLRLGVRKREQAEELRCDHLKPIKKQLLEATYGPLLG